MNIQHHGAVSGVTGSCHQLHIDSDNSILIDCGLFQGNEQDIQSQEGTLAVNSHINSVRALILPQELV